LVLIPGMLNNASLWDAVAPSIRARTHVVTPTFSTQDSMSAMADAVLASTPPGSFALAGFSMGGWVAQEIVQRARGATSALRSTRANAAPRWIARICARPCAISASRS
jgi:pimeloyl-ACP methyl ester carboxylesterase